MTEQAKRRRIQDTLSIAGGGVIAFGIWSLAKICLFLSIADEATLQQLLGLDSSLVLTTVYLLLGAIVLVDMGLRAYIGLSARAEGRGEKKGPFYLIVAALAAMANVASIPAIELGTASGLPQLALVVSIAVEATAVAALVLVIISSLRLRCMGEAKE